MTQLNQTFQSAPVKFQFKFNKNVEVCTFIRSYALAGNEKVIIYKVMFNSPEMMNFFGTSLRLSLDSKGKFVLPETANDEEASVVTKLVRALKAAAYFHGTARDFHPH